MKDPAAVRRLMERSTPPRDVQPGVFPTWAALCYAVLLPGCLLWCAIIALVRWAL